MRFWERNYGATVEQICAGVPDRPDPDGSVARRWIGRGGQAWLAQFRLRLEVSVAARDCRAQLAELVWDMPRVRAEVELGTRPLRATVEVLLYSLDGKADVGLSFLDVDVVGARVSYVQGLASHAAQVCDDQMRVSVAARTDVDSAVAHVWLASRPHPLPPRLVYLVELLDGRARSPGLCAAVACSVARRLRDGSRVVVGVAPRAPIGFSTPGSAS